MNHNRLLMGASMLALALAVAPAAMAEPDPTSPTPVAEDPVSQVDEIVVFGRGQTRQQSSINADAIAVEAPARAR